MLTIAHKEIRKTMIKAAKTGDVVYYGELMKIAGLDHELACDRGFLGEVLADINDVEIKKGNPPLSVVAVSRGESNMPSKGFFEYIDDRGLRKAGEDNVAVFCRLYLDATNTKWK